MQGKARAWLMAWLVIGQVYGISFFNDRDTYLLLISKTFSIIWPFIGILDSTMSTIVYLMSVGLAAWAGLLLWGKWFCKMKSALSYNRYLCSQFFLTCYPCFTRSLRLLSTLLYANHVVSLSASQSLYSLLIILLARFVRCLILSFPLFLLISNTSFHSTCTMCDILITTPNDEFLGSEHCMISSHDCRALMPDVVVFRWSSKKLASSTGDFQLESVDYFEWSPPTPTPPAGSGLNFNAEMLRFGTAEFMASD